MVFDHERRYDSQWAAITSISAKLGMTAETLRTWVRQAERDEGRRPGLTTQGRECLSRPWLRFVESMHPLFVFEKRLALTPRNDQPARLFVLLQAGAWL
jgi:transposase-like protein